MSMDTMFSRELLRLVHAQVKLLASDINLRRCAWVWHAGRDHWEFHGPDGFYWHGSAGNAYDARAKGWEAWIAKVFPTHDDRN